MEIWVSSAGFIYAVALLWLILQCRPIVSLSVGCRIENFVNVGCRKIPLHGYYYIVNILELFAKAFAFVEYCLTRNISLIDE